MALDRLMLALAFALGTLTGVSAARAEDPEPEVSMPDPEAAPARNRWDRLLALEVVGGIDTPYGLFGGAVVVSPFRYLALDVGGGVSRDGGRVAGGARLVLPHENGAFGLRLGFAGGPLSWETRVPGQHLGMIADGDAVPDVTQRRSWDFVGFVDVSLHLEIRLDMGTYARLMFGVEHALAGASSCTVLGDASTTCSTQAFQPVRTYLGLAVGHALF